MIHRSARDEHGFTLAEVMVVVLIIGILSAVGIPTFLGARDRAHDLAARSNVATASTAAAFVSDYSSDLSGASPEALGAAEPSLTYIDGSLASTRPDEISVDASTPGRWVGVARSESGTCFGIELTVQGRTSFISPSCSAGLTAVPTPTSTPATPTTATPTTATPTTATPTTATPTTATPACSKIAIDSFQQTSYTFAFQLRNATSASLDVEFVIPAANYELTNLVFSGSGKGMTLVQTKNGAGTFDLTVSGTIPAYQSAGGQQPNGFNGAITPTSDRPFVRCQATP